MKNLFFIFIATLFFTGCSNSGKINFELDNPTEKIINVTIDSTAYKLQPDHSEKVSLAVGIHTIVLPDGKNVKFNVYDNSKGGIINPTQSLYITFTQVYATNEKAAKNFVAQNRVVYIDSIGYEGAYSLITDLFIDKNFINYSYGLREPLPKNITTYDDKKKGDFRTKIFTKNEFIAFIEEETGTKGYHKKNKKEDAINMPTKSYNYTLPTPNFLDTGMQATAVSIVSILHRYQSSTSSKEQKELLQEYQTRCDEFYEKSKAMDKMAIFDKQTTIEREAYNDFVWTCGQIIAIGITEVK